MARQITTAYPIQYPTGPHVCPTHAVLCNDGTLWILNPISMGWELLPNVPQDALSSTDSVQGTYAAPVTTTPISTAS